MSVGNTQHQKPCNKVLESSNGHLMVSLPWRDNITITWTRLVNILLFKSTLSDKLSKKKKSDKTHSIKNIHLCIFPSVHITAHCTLN